MSLINKMLQDLEQRSDAAARGEPLAGEVRALPGASASRFGPKAVLLVLLLVAAGAAAWVLMQPTAAPPAVAVAPAVAAAPVVALAPSSASPAVAAPAPTPAPAIAIAPVATPAAPSANKASPATPESRATPPQPAVVAKRAADAEAPKPARAAPEAAPVVAQAVTKKPSKVKAVVEEAAPAVEKTPPVAAPAPQGQMQKRVNPQQQSDNLYKQAVSQSQQGRGSEAKQSLRRSLEANANNVRARQMLVGLLVDGNLLEEASNLLREGLKLTPEQSSFSMTLARLQLESIDTAGAMATLEQGLPSANNEPQYHAFYAALLQRAARHEEAVRQYVVALRTDPAMPTWLVGIGISLQALGKTADAAEAFQRARDGGQLTPQMNQFVEQQLGQLRR